MPNDSDSIIDIIKKMMAELTPEQKNKITSSAVIALESNIRDISDALAACYNKLTDLDPKAARAAVDSLVDKGYMKDAKDIEADGLGLSKEILGIGSSVLDTLEVLGKQVSEYNARLVAYQHEQIAKGVTHFSDGREFFVNKKKAAAAPTPESVLASMEAASPHKH